MLIWLGHQETMLNDKVQIISLSKTLSSGSNFRGSNLAYVLCQVWKESYELNWTKNSYLGS